MRLAAVLAVAAACGDNVKIEPPAVVFDAPPPPPCSPVSGTELELRPLGKVKEIAVLATAPPGDERRLFAVDRSGYIRVFFDGVLVEEPFLDLSAQVYLAQTVERGLLGMAFHPQYATNGQFFVFYTEPLHGVVDRCTVSATDPHRANPTCTRVIEILHDRAGNHNGGMIEFGNDGFLYIGTGDGGGAGDPNRRAQDTNDLLGKILRIDVDAKLPGKEYGIPADNPFAQGGGRPEVYILGLRNPWRFSFDRATGDLWIGDVGQGQAEEMNVLRPAQQRGANLGWSLYEGDRCCFDQDDHCLQLANGGLGPLPCTPGPATIFPLDNRDRTTARGQTWASIIAGQTYRGTCYPDLVGWHIYTDFYGGVVVRARLKDDDTLEMIDLPGAFGPGISSIHADARGELYATSSDGWVFHLEAHR